MSMFDLFILVPLILVAGISLWIATMLGDAVFPELKTQMNSTDVNTTVEAATANWDSVMDSSYFFVAIGLGISSIILAFMIDTHPVFFILSIFLMAILLVIAPVFSNTFRSFASADIFGGYTDRFPMTTWLFQNYPLFFLVVGSLMAIAMFAKIQGGGI